MERSVSAFRFACVLLVALASGGSFAHAQNAGGGGIGGGADADFAGRPIEEIRIELRGTQGTGGGANDGDVRRTLGLRPGDAWNDLLIARGIAAIAALPGIKGASHRAVRRINPDGLVLVVTVDTEEAAPRAPSTLFRDERSYLKLMLNGGFGAFSDGNPWFGQPESFTRNNPLVQDRARGAGTGGRASWVEGYLEYGLGGVTQLGDGPVYLYGAATFISPGSFGRDIFRDDTRGTTHVEKLYAGLLYSPADSDLRINASVGRQTFTLNDGFLIAQYGSQWNAGPRPGIYLAPRTTHDFSALLTVKGGGWTSTSFFLDPNEYEPLESRTQVVGTNLRYNFTQRFFVDATYLAVPRSETSYPVPNGPARHREGLQTAAAHLRWADPDLLPGLWVESEIAYQWHRDFPMSAFAGYGTIGYLAKDLLWSPSLSWRYAVFSGDNPETGRYERFDPLFSGGLSEWLQGITINKVLSQANRQTHRLRFNLTPEPALNLTLDWFIHRADQSNNRGGNPALSQLRSDDLGQELQFATRWAVSRQLYFVGVASLAMPGRAIRLATPGKDKPWSSLQAQFYLSF